MTVTPAPISRNARLWWALFVIALPTAVVLTVVAAEGQHTYQLVSLSFPGAMTANLSAVLELVALISSTLCLGSAVYSAFLRVRVGHDRMTLDYSADLKVVSRSAVVWLCAAIALVPVDAVDSNGLPLSRLLTPGALPYLVDATYLPRAWIAVVICAALVCGVAFFARKWTSLVFIVGVSTIGVLAPVVVNQVLVGPNHDFGGDAAIVATPLTAAVTGALGVLVFRLLSGRRISASTTGRFFTFAATAWTLIVVTTVIVCLFELAGGSPFATSTGELFLVRFVLLALSGAAGYAAWRRRGVLASVDRKTVGWLVFASVCLSLYLGLVEGMTKIAPPQYVAPTDISQVFLGYEVKAAPTVSVLLLDWRVNILFLILAVAGVGLYGFAYVRLRRRHDAWPKGRAISWFAGWAVIVFTTSSGIGRYSTASFSTHMILHMSLNMLGPILLVLGGPITLALRYRRPIDPISRRACTNGSRRYSRGRSSVTSTTRCSCG